MNASSLVTKAIDDLLNPAVKLGDALLKLKAVAFTIGNDKLKEFVKHEIEGYTASGLDIPHYRRVGAKLKGNLVTGYGHQQNNLNIPVEYLKDDEDELYSHRPLPQGVTELEHLVKKGKNLFIDIPAPLIRDIQKQLYSKSPWKIHSAWQELTAPSVEGVLNAIRNKALEVVLEIKSQYGDDLQLDSLKTKQEVNELVNKSLQYFTVENGGVLNFASGDSSLQATNTGQGAINASTGTGAIQSISGEQSNSLSGLVEQIKHLLSEESAFDEHLEEMDEELKRVEVQLKREEPKKSIIKRSFESLKELAADAAGITAGHAVFELIKQGMLLAQ